MALDRTQLGFWQELDASWRVLEPHLVTYTRDCNRVCGRDYGTSQEPDEPENGRLLWLRQTLPQIAFANPRAIIDSGRPEWAPERSVALMLACNQNAEQRVLREKMHRCMVDLGLRWTQGVCNLKPKLGYEDQARPPLQPDFDRVSCQDFRWDSTAIDRDGRRWEAHPVSYDIEDLIHDAERNPGLGWDLATLRALEPMLGPDPELSERGGTQGQGASILPPRKQLRVWNIWERNYRLKNAPPSKNGYFGTLFYVVDQRSVVPQYRKAIPAQWIRRPESYFGLPWGPYPQASYLMIGDLPVPLSPMIANGPRSRWLNTVARALQRAVREQKRVGVVWSPDLQQQLEAAVDGAIICTQQGTDARALVAQLQVGGLDQSLVAAFELALEQEQRQTGFDEASRGNIQGVATATEVDAATTARTLSTGFIVEQARYMVEQIFRQWAFWYDLHGEVTTDVGPIPDEIADKLGIDPRMMRLTGGSPEGSNWSALDHFAADMRVDAYSMSATTESTLRQQQAEIFGMMQGIAALPPHVAMAVDVPWLLQRSERAGIRDATRLINPKIFYATQALVLGQQGGEAPGGQPAAQPRIQVKPQAQGAQGGGWRGGAKRSPATQALGKSSMPQGQKALAGSGYGK